MAFTQFNAPLADREVQYSVEVEREVLACMEHEGDMALDVLVVAGRSLRGPPASGSTPPQRYQVVRVVMTAINSLHPRSAVRRECRSRPTRSGFPEVREDEGSIDSQSLAWCGWNRRDVSKSG
jgi:hypothetical protein